MKEKVKLGIIGLGNRGGLLLSNVIAHFKDVEICAVSDVSDRKMQKAKAIIEKEMKNTPLCLMDHHDLLAMDDIDAVVVFTGWQSHIPVAIEAMEAGKYVGIEVGGAYNLNDCQKLVDAYERTKMPCMMLENCCYGRVEMMVLSMVKQGLFGEIVHCAGGYQHDLCAEDLVREDETHYRLREYIYRNADTYPTHDLGPIAKVLNINRGNRMLYLTSMASKSAGLQHYIADKYGVDDKRARIEFMQGDIVTTTIKCAMGQTITLTLDTTLPRPYYSRNFTVRGTKGIYMEERETTFIKGGEIEKTQFNNEEYFEKYDHPLWKEYKALGEKGGHGGMDWLVMRAFVESVKRGEQTPIDVYDTAAWMSITPLSEQSIASGSMPVAIPDYTSGKWINREPIVRGKYCLEEVCEDNSISIY